MIYFNSESKQARIGLSMLSPLIVSGFQKLQLRSIPPWCKF